jgi:hypothetical protein
VFSERMKGVSGQSGMIPVVTGRTYVPILLLAVVVSGCGYRSRQATVPQPLATVAEPLLLPGDCLRIVVVNRDNLELRQVIDPVGDIHLPYGVKLHVAGTTLSQVGKSIEMAYVPDGNLKVSVLNCN